ncbi:hypothetical protein Tco_1051254 [Tanacetum coccineum]
MESVKETVKIRVCKGGAWERVDGALEYMPLNCVKRTLILPLLSSYSCLLEAVSERLEIDANSDFMVTYNSDNDIVEAMSNVSMETILKLLMRNFQHLSGVLDRAKVGEGFDEGRGGGREGGGG